MSQLFSPIRCIGVVCDSVPPVIRYHPLHREFYLTTAAERKLLTYKVSNLGLKATSDTLPSDCLCLATRDGQLLAGCSDGSVWQIRNGLDADRLTRVPDSAGVQLLVAFGDLLVGLDAKNRINVWRFDGGPKKTEEEDEDKKDEDKEKDKDKIDAPPSQQLRMLSSIEFDRDTCRLTAACHPHLYTNKVLLGSKEGRLQLWNVARSRLVHSFDLLDAGVSCLEQAPAEDVAAVGLTDGRVLLINLRLDRRIAAFRQDFGAVTGVAFRTDGQPVMLTGSEQGHVSLWHLEERRLCGLLTEAHAAAVSGLVCPHSQPLVVTSAGDNSLKVWLFDRADHLPRLLHQRSGHSLPITHLEFYDKDLLTCAPDCSLRSFSLEHEKYNRHFGKGRVNKKDQLPPAETFRCETARHGDWCTLVALHRNSRTATTWDVRKGCQGKRRLEPQQMLANESKFKSTFATCVSLSLCGNFALIGYSSGHVIRFNVQSGRESHKRECRPPLSAACVSVHVDACNRVVMATSASPQICLFAFRTGERLRELSLTDSEMPTAVDHHRLSSLVAVATNSRRLLVYQLTTETKAPLRCLRHRLHGEGEGEARPIGCLRFSPDGRWLLVGSGDSVATYSVLHGKRIDTLTSCYGSVKCVAMTPSGDMLVTAHEGRLGMQLWVNTTLFRPLPGSDPSALAAAGAASASDDASLVTLAGLPTNRWRWLSNLEEIRRRNRPLEAPVVPKSAPFFLSVDAVNGAAKGAVENGESTAAEMPKEAEEAEEAEKKGDFEKLAALSDLSAKLLRAAAVTDAEQRDSLLLETVVSLELLGPTAIDSELRDLDESAYSAFVAGVAACLRRHCHYETSQAYLGLFLKHHGLRACEVPECVAQLRELAQLQRLVWRRLENAFQETDSLLAYTRDGVVGNVQ